MDDVNLAENEATLERGRMLGATANGHGGHLSLEGMHNSVAVPHHTASFWAQYRAFVGPALLVSVGYMDPGNWVTDLQGGAQYKYDLLWVVALSSVRVNDPCIGSFPATVPCCEVKLLATKSKVCLMVAASASGLAIARPRTTAAAVPTMRMESLLIRLLQTAAASVEEPAWYV